MRPIDADALELEPDQHNVMNGVRFDGRGGGRTVSMVQITLKHMIDNAPTIDAVPVVRCVECKHRGDYDRCPMRHLAYTTDEGYLFVDYTQDDSFCSFGEKKEGGPDV